MSGIPNADRELQAAELKNIANVKEVIKRSENPNPLVVVIIILATILAMYFMFVQFVKKSISGLWSDANGNINEITHNKWKDSIVLNHNFNGFIKGHMVAIYINNSAKLGLWMNDRINWIDGSTWECLEPH